MTFFEICLDEISYDTPYLQVCLEKKKCLKIFFSWRNLQCSPYLQWSCNLSIRSAAVEMGISPCLLVRWYQKRPKFEASLGKSKAICKGPEGQLHHIKDEILQWIFARREQGIAVTMSHVVYKATSILHHQEDDTAFKDNGFTAPAYRP